MRGWIGDHFGPVFHRIVDRFDPAVQVEDHHALATRLLSDPTIAWDADASLDALRDMLRSRIDRATQPGSANRLAGAVEANVPTVVGDADITRIFELSSVTRASASSAGTEDAEIEQAIVRLSDSECWSRDAAAATEASRHLLVSLLEARSPRATLLSASSGALAALPPRSWFLFKRGTFFGSSTLLMSLVRMRAIVGQNELDPTVREVLDRLIRHIEVRRNEALGFATGAPIESSAALAERLRFALCLIEASAAFADLRYLNTAMKLVDRSSLEIQKALEKTTPGAIEIPALGYLIAFAAQEARLDRVLTR